MTFFKTTLIAVVTALGLTGAAVAENITGYRGWADPYGPYHGGADDYHALVHEFQRTTRFQHLHNPRTGRNSVAVIQTGRRNALGLSQSGNRNTARVIQRGNNTNVILNQNGNDNFGTVLIFGR